MEWDIARAGLRLVLQALPDAHQFIRPTRRVIPAEGNQPEQVIITLAFDVVGLATAAEKFGKQGRLSNDEPTENSFLSGAALVSAIEAEFRRLAALDDDESAATLIDLAADEAGLNEDAEGGDSEMPE